MDRTLLTAVLGALLLGSVPQLRAGEGGERPLREAAERPREGREQDGLREREEAARQEQEAEERAMHALMEREVTLDFEETPFREVLDFIRRVGHVNLVVHQATYAERKESPVTLKLKDVALKAALEVLARSMDLEVAWIEKTVYLGPPPQQQPATARLRVPSFRDTLELDLRADEIPAEARREMVERFLNRLRDEGDRGRGGWDRGMGGRMPQFLRQRGGGRDRENAPPQGPQNKKGQEAEVF